MKELINLLQNNPQVDEYRILEAVVSSTELFFIKEELQMNRAKDVTNINIYVYKNFEENGIKFKGSSVTKINPTNTPQEIEEKINQAALAASFVKNEYYSLVEPTNDIAPDIPSAFKGGDLIKNVSNLVKDLYEEDNQFGAFINSSEFFINKKVSRLVNSKGLDISFESYRGEIELVIEANGEKESIEIFDVLHFSDYDSAWIKESIINQLKHASLRAKAVPMPQVENLPVILDGKAASGLWTYYIFNSLASQKYEKLHDNNIGDEIQGKNIIGDKVSITLKPYIPNSTASSYYDGDGVFLKETILVKDGILKTFSSSKRYADYLNIEPTGNLRNIVVSGGSKTEKELKTGPYLELISFSAFQADPMTGNFGGEFRLGIYFDGEKEIPVTLGTVSANIKKAQKEMFLSKELVKNDHFIGPKLIKFNNITIAGN
jgi:PmbA protein